MNNFNNHADDNSIIMYSSRELKLMFSNLKIDRKNAIIWFTTSGMKDEPSKFQFMLISNE